MKYLFAITMILIAGCSTNPKNIGSAYVSPLTYSKYDCDQLQLEMNHVSRRTLDLYASLKKRNKKDKWSMGLGMVIFWPSLFFLSGGDGPEATEYAQLQGEEEAIREVMVQKRCDLPPTSNELIQDSVKQVKPQATEEPADEYEAIKSRPQSSSMYIPQKQPQKYSALRNGETVYITRKK